MRQKAAEALETETIPRELGEESISTTQWRVRTMAGAPPAPSPWCLR